MALNDINCFLVNIRGIESNYLNLINYINNSNTNYDCILLTECWVKHQNSLIDKDIEGFEIFHASMTQNRASGVILYIKKDSFDSISLSSLKTSVSFDCLQLSLTINKQPTTLVIIYRSPSLTPSICLSEIDDLLSTINEPNVILAGDLNFDIAPENINQFGYQYLTTLNSKGLTCLSNKTTRSSTSRNSCLDHIFFRGKNINVTFTNTIKLDFTDHFAIEFKIIPITNLLKDNANTNTQCINKINFDLLNEHISKHNWNDVFDIEDIEMLTSKLLNDINILINLSTDVINFNTENKMNKTKLKIPWINKKIIKLINEKKIPTCLLKNSLR